MYEIYGHELSLFSRKLEAAFIFYGTDFKFSTQNPEMNQRAGTHQIPVLRTPENWVLADTTPIMQMMDARVPERALFPSGQNALLVRLIEEFLDEWVARVMVHYRWHYPESAEFAAIRLGNGNEEIAKAIANWGPRACRATGTESQHQQQAAEKEYEALVSAAEQQLKETNYLLGNRPCAVDAMMLGGLRAHTYADPVPKRMVSKYPGVVKWLETEADQWDGTGGLLNAENPSAFAQHVLSLMKETYKPFILGNNLAIEQGDKFFLAHVYGEEVSFLARPYPEQSRQVLSAFISGIKDSKEKQAAMALLEKYQLKEIFC